MPKSSKNPPEHSSHTSSQKVAIYIRVSTRWQIDKDSLPMQREELPKYAEIVLGITDYEIFEDAGFSGKNTDRPAFQQMMSRCRQGDFSHILVYKLDRISRNLLDFAAMYQELRKLGITFISKNEQFDTSTAIGEAMLKIILVFAELERNMTSERVQATMINRAQNAQWNGGKIPFGYSYDKEKKEFSIVEDEKDTILSIYKMNSEGETLLKICNKLNASKTTLRRGCEWSPTTVRSVLINPFYIGTYRYNRTSQGALGARRKPEKEWVLIPDHHPAIIEKAAQEAAIKNLQDKDWGSTIRRGTYIRKNANPFAGLLICGICGSPFYSMSGRIDKKTGDRPSVYTCSGRRNHGNCTNKAVTDAEIGPFALAFLSNYLKAQNSFGQSTSMDILKKKLLRGEFFENLTIDENSLKSIYAYFRTTKFGTSDFMTLILENSSADTTEDLSKERTLLEQEQKRIERALQRLKAIYLYSDDSMSEKDYITEKAQLQADLEKATKRIEELKALQDAVQGPSSPDFPPDDEFMQAASLLVIQEELVSKRDPNFEKLISVLDPEILRNFLNFCCKNFCIFSGEIRSITLKNGILVKFLEKPKNKKPLEIL